MDSWYRKKRYPQSARVREAEEKAFTNVRGLSPAACDRSYSCTIYPNGEFGVGQVPRPKKRRAESDYDKNIASGTPYTLQPRRHELEDGQVLQDTTDMFLQPSLKLGSSSESSQTPEKPKKRYGLKGITGYGKKNIRNIAYQIETSDSIGIPQMGTLTIPKISLEGNRVLCQSWSDITRSFFQECRRAYKKYGMHFEYVSCTEIQEQRFHRHGDCGLHLHFIYKARRKPHSRDWVIHDSWVRLVWKRLLEGALRKAPQVSTKDLDKVMSTTINYRREKIKKSAAAYMAKYLSKGSGIIDKVADVLGEDYLPRQWWSADSLSKERLKRACIKSRGDIARILVDICAVSVPELIIYAFPMTYCRDDGKDVCIGYFGRLTNAGMEFISALTKR